MRPNIVYAGLMQIQFEFTDESENLSGFGHYQFEDIPEDVWVDVANLVDFEYGFVVAGASSSYAYSSDNVGAPAQADLPGAIRIRMVAENAYVADYSQTPIYDSGMDWYEGRTPYEHVVSSGEYFLVGSDIYAFYMTGEMIERPRWSGEYKLGIGASGELGSFETSVWFDDPPPEVPIPPSAILLLSALLPVFGIKKWRRK